VICAATIDAERDVTAASNRVLAWIDLPCNVHCVRPTLPINSQRAALAAVIIIDDEIRPAVRRSFGTAPEIAVVACQH
jgi:hypothetical protein